MFNIARTTSDYSPLQPYTEEYQTAVRERKEMMKNLADRGSSPTNQPKRKKRRKTWQSQMQANAKDFNSKENLERHYIAERKRATARTKAAAVINQI